MKRVVWCLLLGLSLLGPGRLAGAGPDDDFIRIYALIQQGDTFFQNNRVGEARARYGEALRLLEAFEKNYPGWNDALIRFRKQYLQERIGAPPPAPGAGAGVAAPAALAAPENPQVATLREELKQLAAERDLLQARLREALAAQPAAADPRELARAQERIGTLQREIEQLRAEIVARDARLAEAANARQLQDQLAEARQALADARQTLTRQNETVTNLTRQIETLQRQLEETRARATAPPADATAAARTREELEAARRQTAALQARVAELEKQLAARPAPAAPDLTRLREELEQTRRQNLEWRQRVADLEARLATATKQLEAARAEKEKAAATRPPAERDTRKPAPTVPPADTTRQLNELRERLEKLQQELATERWRAENFKAEKELLEKRVAELTAAKPAAPPAAAAPAPPAAAPATPPAAAPAHVQTNLTREPAPGSKQEKVLAKYQREADKARIRQLERDRDELTKRLRVLSRQLEDLRRQTAHTGTNTASDQLAILRARLEAYESKAVPYTPEELALMKQTAGVSGATTNTAEIKDTRRALRQIPAGAATLVSEGQRAFQLRRYDEAERKFAQALQLDERNVDMLTYLAAAQLEQERFREAEATLQRALAVDPNNADGVSLLGLLRFRQGRFDEAFDLLSRAAQLNPDNPYTQNYLGVTLSQRGQRAAAETALRRAVALDPNYGEAHANLAVVYALARPPALELARYHYQKARALGQPANPDLERRLEPAAAAAPAAPGR
jgi:Flp pilus assembly protein TadD